MSKPPKGWDPHFDHGFRKASGRAALQAYHRNDTSAMIREMENAAREWIMPRFVLWFCDVYSDRTITLCNTCIDEAERGDDLSRPVSEFDAYEHEGVECLRCEARLNQHGEWRSHYDAGAMPEQYRS